MCLFTPVWTILTSFKNILQTVKGDQIEFINTAPRNSLCPKSHIESKNNMELCQESISLLNKKTIIETFHIFTLSHILQDLKDAYYTVKIDDNFQKYLKFWYDIKLYKLGSNPRHFEKGQIALSLPLFSIAN